MSHSRVEDESALPNLTHVTLTWHARAQLKAITFSGKQQQPS